LQNNVDDHPSQGAQDDEPIKTQDEGISCSDQNKDENISIDQSIEVVREDFAGPPKETRVLQDQKEIPFFKKVPVQESLVS